jgi:hypothetical protein
MTIYAHWKLNENSGSIVYDSSGNGRHLTTINTEYDDWIPALLHNGLRMNQGTDIDEEIAATSPSICDFTRINPWTFECWIKLNSLESEINFYYKKQYAGINVGINITYEYAPMGPLGINVWFAPNYPSVNGYLGVKFPCTFDVGTWYHVVISYNGSIRASGIKGYINSIPLTPTVLADDLYLSTADVNNNGNLRIGYNNDILPYSNCIRGLLDETVIYSHVLTPEEVISRYNDGIGREDFASGLTSLSSEQDNLATSNLGQIKIDSIDYVLPQSISIVSETLHDLEFIDPSPSLKFDHWVVSDNVSIENLNSQITHFTVVGFNPTIKAIYKLYLGIPTVTTQLATNIKGITATGNGNIIDIGGVNCTKRGVEWGTILGGPYPNSAIDTGSYGIGVFTKGMTSLIAETLYYYRTKVYNSYGWGYGEEQSFTTRSLASLYYEEDETGDVPLVEIFPDTVAFYDNFADWAISGCTIYKDTVKFNANGSLATMMADWDESDWLYISTRIKFDQEGVGGSLILQINLGGGWITLETYTTSGRFSTICTPYGSGIRLMRSDSGVGSNIYVDYLVLSAKEKRSLTENIIGLNVKLQSLNKGINSCEVDLFNENFEYSTNNPYDFKVSDYIMIWIGTLGSGIRNKIFDGRISEIDYSGAGYGTQKIVINGQAFSAEMNKPPVILYKRYTNINGETILDDYLADLVQVKKSVDSGEWFDSTIVTLFNTRFDGKNPLSVFQNILENSYNISDERGMEVVEVPPGILIGHEKDSTEWKVNTTLYPNKYTKSDDLTPLYNCIDIFGNNLKMYPSNGDSWTEGFIAGWIGLYGSIVSLTSVPSPKVGTNSVKVLVAPQVVTWQEWYQEEGWGNGYYPPWGLRYTHFEQTISCFPGKKIRFHAAGVYETLAADGCVRIYYRFGDTDPWIQLVTPPPAEVGGSYRELYPWTVAPEYVEGPTETNLNVKWEMETFAYKTSMFSNFRIYYLEVPLGTQEKFAAKFTLPILDYPNGLDLDLPDSPTKLEFVLGSLIEEPSSGTDSNPTVFIRMNMKDAAPITYHGEFSGIKGGDWETFSIDVGPDADNQGWSSIPTGKVRSIEFEFTVYTDFYHATDFLQIDWLHFGSAKFSGTYSDAASIAQYGERWAETVEDTTLLSDAQCDLKAKTLVLMNKDPVLTFSPIEVDGSTIYVPSFLINVRVPNENFNQWLSILEIEHKLEGTEWLTSLTIGAEPVTIDYVIRNMRGK